MQLEDGGELRQRRWARGAPAPRRSLCVCSLVAYAIVITAVLLVAIARTAEEEAALRPDEATGKAGAVAADHRVCSQMGLERLQAGGNAIDAAVTTALCQGVVRPFASGLGGGAFILLRMGNGTAEVIDAREEAPAAAHETMYVGSPERSLIGGEPPRVE